MTLRPDDGADNPRRKAGRDEGRRRKDAALDRHEVRHAVELLIVRRQFAARLLSHGIASLNDLDLSRWLCGHHLGAVHQPFAREKMIVENRMVPNQREGCNGRRIIEWRQIDADAVRQWLADHLAPPISAESSSPTTQRTLWADATGGEVPHE